MRSAMIKLQNNFVCNPNGPWGPILDSTIHEESLIMKFRFVDYQMNLNIEDEENLKTIQRLKDIFTQFKDKKN
jgi:hypothetical protein